MRGRFSVRSDSFHRQNVQLLRDCSVSKSYTRDILPPADRNSNVHENFDKRDNL
jgi:hypothetical protein